MTQKFLLLYINKNNLLVTRILTSEKFEDEVLYETEDQLDLSARKRRDILVHHISLNNSDDIRYIMTISTAKPKQTITGTETADQFISGLLDNEKSRKDLFDNLVASLTEKSVVGNFDIRG